MAGPVFNLLFAWLIFIVLCMIGVPTVTTKIGEALKDKPAAKAGMQKGDVITAINNKPINRWDQIAEGVAASKGKPLTLTVKRGDRDITFTITPEPRVSKNLFGEKINGYAIGVASAGEIVTEYFNPFQAVIKGTEQTWKVIDLTFMSLVKMVQRVVPMDSVGGPIMIAKMAGEQASAGRRQFSGIHGAALDQSGCTQPAAGTGAGWRASAVLFHGVDLPPAGSAKGSRIRPADRDGAAVGLDGSGLLQRYHQVFRHPPGIAVNILAIDTSTSLASIAIAVDEQIVAESLLQHQPHAFRPPRARNRASPDAAPGWQLPISTSSPLQSAPVRSPACAAA